MQPLQRVVKLVYQSCSRLRAALGSSLIRDTDGSRLNGSINVFLFDDDHDVPDVPREGSCSRVGYY